MSSSGERLREKKYIIVVINESVKIHQGSTVSEREGADRNEKEQEAMRGQAEE